jgi:hypothetical protein
VRVPVTLGVVAASTLASLLGDRNLAAGLVFALCNAAEALLVAWLIKRHFGENFRLESLRKRRRSGALDFGRRYSSSQPGRSARPVAWGYPRHNCAQTC